MQLWAQASGLELEQVADMFDKVAKQLEGQNSTQVNVPDSLATMKPIKGKH